MKTLKFSVAVLILAQMACQKNNNSENTMGLSGAEMAIHDGSLVAQDALLPQSSDKILIPYEASMLNSYPDMETRKVFNDILTKSTIPAEAMYNSQLLNIQQASREYLVIADQQQRPDVSEISQISALYKKELSKIENEFGVKKLVLDDLDRFGTGLSIYAGSTGIGLAPAIAFEVTKSAFVKYTEKRMSALEEEAKNQATTLVISEINKMSLSQMEALSKLNTLDPEQARSQAEGLMKDLTYRLIPSDLPQKDQTALNAAIGKRIGEETYGLLVQFKNAQNILNSNQELINQNLDERVLKAEKNIVSLTKSVDVFKKETVSQISSLFETQKNIVSFINEQSAQIGNITKGVAEIDVRTKFLADYMFGKMSATEQIKALQSGVYGDPKSPVIQDLLSQKEQIFQREKFNADIKTLINNVQGISVIASRLGVDPDIVAKISDGAKYADAAMNTASQLASLNYIGAALTLTGLLGGGSVDPSAVRHKEIMGFLQKLDLKLDKVIEMQQETMQMIIKVSDQIQQSTIFIANRIYSVQYLQLSMNETLESILNKDLTSCHVVKASIQREYDGSHADFLLNSTLSNQAALATCAQTMDSRFFVDKIGPKYSLSTFLKVSDIGKPEAQEGYYNALRAYVISKPANDVQRIYGSLLDPVRNYVSLRKKISDPSISNNKSEGGALYERRLHPMAITEDANLLLGLLPSLVIYQNLRTKDDLLSAANPRLGYRHYQMLTTAVEWLNRGIAQENALSGDAILELIYKDRDTLEKEIKCSLDDQSGASPYCLLKLSPMLRHNFTIYSILRDLDQKGHSASVLMAALAVHKKGEQNAFEPLLGRQLNIDYAEDNSPSAISLVGEKVNISIIQNLANTTFLHSPALPHLLELRNSIIRKLGEMRLNTYLTENQRRYLNYKVIPQ